MLVIDPTLIGLILLGIACLTYPWSLEDSSCILCSIAKNLKIYPLMPPRLGHKEFHHSFPDFIVELAYQISDLSLMLKIQMRLRNAINVPRFDQN
jgi:hypothetical protein